MKPIIRSLLDTDFYKFTMGQVVFHHYPSVNVRYAFKNRTKGIALSQFINEDDLRMELDRIRSLKFNTSEIRYLRGADIGARRMFSHEYLYFLENQLQLPPYELKYDGDNFTLEVEGDWAHAIYWEIPMLATINELYYRGWMKSQSKFRKGKWWANGIVRLAGKLDALGALPVSLVDFGTRRRFSLDWHDCVVETLSDELTDKQFRGTSNAWLAMKYGLKPMGTSAHEMFMILAGVLDDGTDESVRASYRESMRLWYRFYGYELSIALTDTYGSLYHLETMARDEAQDWKGVRQDSGDPVWFGEKIIETYKRHRIDHRDKMIIFSDGLELPRIVELFRRFNGRIRTSFGWGTNLTNDLGFAPLSLVIKPVMANGRGLVKLSDNPAKAVGNPEDIERYRRIFNYREQEYAECKY